MLQGKKITNLTASQINEIEIDLRNSKTEKDIQQPFFPNNNFKFSNNIQGNNIFSSILISQKKNTSKRKSFNTFQPSKQFQKSFLKLLYPKINENEKSDIETSNTPEKTIEAKEIDLKELYNEMINEGIIQKLILNRNINGLKEEIQKFDSDKELQIKLLSEVDKRGNTPVMLTILLHCMTKEKIFKDILLLLLENHADFKKKDLNLFTPLDLAISYENRELVSILYDKYVKRRSEKFRRNLREISNYFKGMNDFYVELKWKVHVPLLSFLCPNDVCPIWKKGTNIRMDTSFVDFKNLSTIRNPNSFMMLTNNKEEKNKFN